MRIELVTIGDELLLGYTIDGNAAVLARALAAIGVEIVRRETVGDDADHIAAAVGEALARTGAVITTGGLGPTSDDRTRPAVAAVFGRALRCDDALVDALRARFAALGRTMPESNLAQAMVPEGARVLANRHGSAPGLWLEDDAGRWVAMLPGVPREMQAMTHDTIVPLLTARLGDAPTVVASLTLRTTGIGESALADLLGDDGRGAPGLELAYLPGWEGVDLRLTVRELPADAASERLRAAAARLCARLGPTVYGEDGTDLAALVLERCRASGLTIATAESCTGGLLGARLTAVPGASDVYHGGIVAYDNRVKESMLRVPGEMLREHGAVSEPVAVRMAESAASALGTRIGIAITGVAGPDGGTPAKPVGTVWIAARIDDAVEVRHGVFVGDREEIRRRATQSALDLIRIALPSRERGALDRAGGA